MSRTAATIVLILLGATSCFGEDHAFRGEWDDTGNRTRGPMSAGVRDHGDGNVTIRFRGIFTGVPFDYTIRTKGKLDKLSGEDRINGAKYKWSAVLKGDKFTGKFTSNRGHLGTWTMQRVKR